MAPPTGKQKRLFYTATLTDADVLLCFSTSEEWLSRREIAERLWRQVTPSLCKRIESLVTSGALTKHIAPLSNHQQMFWYRRA